MAGRVVQLDYVEGELELRVWRPDEEMPAEPLLTAADDTYQSGMPLVFFWSQGSAGQAEFEYVWILEAPDAAMTAPAVVVMSRLVVTGGNSTRLHEELTAAGGLLQDGRFTRLNVTQTEAILSASKPMGLKMASS